MSADDLPYYSPDDNGRAGVKPYRCGFCGEDVEGDDFTWQDEVFCDEACMDDYLIDHGCLDDDLSEEKSHND